MEHTKKLTAQVQIEYNDLIGDTSEIQEFSLPIEVPYIEIQVQPNYGLILIVIIGIIFVLVLIIPRRKEITKDRNQKAIASLERETKKAMQKIKKKSNSGGSKKVKKQVKKIKNSPKQ